MSPTITDIAGLAAYVRDGDRVVGGGLPLWRKPLALLREIAASGRTGLRYSAFLASLDAEILVSAGCVSEFEYGYAGRDLLGASRVLARATSLDRRTRTEFEYFGALTDEQDAFGNHVPAARYDVCVLHATCATHEGDIYADPLDAMEEDDRLLTAAADTVLVTVERIVDRSGLGDTAVWLLPAAIVTALAVAPHGAAPLGLAGEYPPDLAALDGVPA